MCICASEHEEVTDVMCFGIPMQIVEIDGFIAKCEAKGVQREVNLSMMQDEDFNITDFVVVNLGYAIQKISKQDAEAAWDLYDEILNAEHGIGSI